MKETLEYLSAQSSARWEIVSFLLLAAILGMVIFVGLNGLEQVEIAKVV